MNLNQNTRSKRRRHKAWLRSEKSKLARFDVLTWVHQVVATGQVDTKYWTEREGRK